jgi:hypothetical protein
MQQQPNIYMTTDNNKKMMLTNGSQAVLVGTSALHHNPSEQNKD